MVLKSIDDNSPPYAAKLFEDFIHTTQDDFLRKQALRRLFDRTNDPEAEHAVARLIGKFAEQPERTEDIFWVLNNVRFRIPVSDWDFGKRPSRLGILEEAVSGLHRRDVRKAAAAKLLELLCGGVASPTTRRDIRVALLKFAKDVETSKEFKSVTTIRGVNPEDIRDGHHALDLLGWGKGEPSLEEVALLARAVVVRALHHTPD